MALKDVREEPERLRSQLSYFGPEASGMGPVGGELVRVLDHVQRILAGLTDEVERLDAQAQPLRRRAKRPGA